MKKRKILLIQADTTQTLPMAKSLSKKGFSVHIVVSSRLTYGYGSRYVSKRYIYSNYRDIEGYKNFIKNLLNKTPYDFIIPMADEGAIVLSKYRDELLKLSSFKMPDFETFERGYDKHRLMELCAQEKFPHPRTISVESSELKTRDIESLKYPVLIKPNISCGARGITYVETPHQLIDTFSKVYKEYGPCHIQEFIPSGGAQVEVQIYINEEGKLVQGSVISKFRWYPNKGGSSCCNQSVDNEKIIDICYNVLKKIGWIGFADFDTIEDPRTGELLIMEINPRVPACVKTAFEAGIDWAEVIVSEYGNMPHEIFKFHRHIFLRHLGFDTLWFINSKNKFSSKPSWFKFFGKKVYYQDMNGWSDPFPFILGSFGNILKQLSPSFRKSKAGI